MKVRQIWERNAYLILILWVALVILLHFGWLIFLAGIIGFIAILYFTAPGVFWNYLFYFIPYNSQPTKANKILKKAISYNPVIPQPYTALGVFYAKNQNWSEAIPLLEKAANLSSKNKAQELKTVLAVGYREIEDYSKALEILNRIIVAGQPSFKIYYNIALTQLMQNNLADALETAKKARSLNLSAIEPVLLLGKVYFRMSDFKEAKDNYEWVVDHSTWAIESYYWLGRVEFELGEFTAAADHLQKAVERITDDPVLSDITAAEAEEWLELAQAKTGNNVVEEDSSGE